MRLGTSPPFSLPLYVYCITAKPLKKNYLYYKRYLDILKVIIKNAYILKKVQTLYVCRFSVCVFYLVFPTATMKMVSKCTLKLFNPNNIGHARMDLKPEGPKIKCKYSNVEKIVNFNSLKRSRESKPDFLYIKYQYNSYCQTIKKLYKTFCLNLKFEGT